MELHLLVADNTVKSEMNRVSRFSCKKRGNFSSLGDEQLVVDCTLPSVFRILPTSARTLFSVVLQSQDLLHLPQLEPVDAADELDIEFEMVQHPQRGRKYDEVRPEEEAVGDDNRLFEVEDTHLIKRTLSQNTNEITVCE